MQTSNSGIHHIRVGDAVVTALNEGMMTAATDWVAGIPGSEVEAQLRANHRPVPPRVTINAFLLCQGDRRVLIDAGMGNAGGPDFGHARRRLDVLGIAPGDIDTVLVTHAHIDHVSGLLDDDGEAWFPNAELVMHDAEPAFWLDDAVAAKAPAEAKEAFALARRCLKPYSARTRLVQHGGEALPGVTVCHLPGHTPGHSGWIIASGSDKLLIWGDVVHLPGLQFARPDAGMAFDVDVEQGRASRLRAFDMAATDGLMVAGMHLEFPAFGRVIRAGSGFSYLPELWTPEA